MKPLIHQTDLYHPHEDPDDHFDLATVFALAKASRWDPKGVLVDYPPDREEGDPAAGAVLQLSRLTGIAGVPVCVGTRHGMRSRTDDQADRDPVNLAAASWVCQVLEASPEPVVINISGSCTDVALAGLMDPDVFRRKCRGIYVNAGSAFPNEKGDLEYNVMLNPSSFAAVFDIPCPVYWCPCFHKTNTWEVGENGTWWSFVHEDLLPRLNKGMCNYFLFMLGRLHDMKYLRYLDGTVDEKLLGKFAPLTRNMWCTAPLLHAAGMGVDLKRGLKPADELDEPLFEFISVSIDCANDGRTTWKPDQGDTKRFVFRIRKQEMYPELMTQALLDLLGRV